MSISDDLMWRYYELLSFQPWSDVLQWKKNCDTGENPRNYKVKLAQEIIERFHDDAAATNALEKFEARFQRGALPDEIDEVELKIKTHTYYITNMLKDAGLTASTSEAIRMINQGAVKLDGEKISDVKQEVAVGSDISYKWAKENSQK